MCLEYASKPSWTKEGEVVIVAGCSWCFSPHHLHEETKILPVKELIISKQFLLGCHRRCYSNYNITQLESTSRHVRIDLRIYEESIWNFVQHPLDRDWYMAVLIGIHRDRFRDNKLPHECRTWRSPTAYCRRKSAVKKSGSSTTEVGKDQQVEFLLIPHRTIPKLTTTRRSITANRKARIVPRIWWNNWFQFRSTEIDDIEFFY